MFAKIKFLCFIIGIFSIYSSCDNSKKTEKSDFTLYKDDLDRIIMLNKKPERILSLAPSVTEMLCLICDTSKIIGRTPYCNYPLSISNKPIVNNYPPDLEKILFLKPDLVITKDGMISMAQAEAIEKMGFPVYIQKYNTIDDIFNKMNELAFIIGNVEIGKKYSDSLKLELSKINTNSMKSASPKKVLALISKDRYFSFGKDTYASDIITQAGGVNAVDTVFANPYPVLTSEYILYINPDIIIGGEGVGLNDNFFEIHPELKRTKAFQFKNYYTINDDYLSRPGPRVLEAVKAINAIILKSDTNEIKRNY